MKRLAIIILITMIVMLMGVSAQDYLSYQDDAQNSGLGDDYDIGFFTSTGGVQSSSFVDVGTDYIQPLVADIDNDNVTEIVTFDGNSIFIAEGSKSGGILVEASLDLNQSVTFQPALFDHDGDGYMEIYSMHQSSTSADFFILEWNGTQTITVEFKYDVPTTLVYTGNAIDSSGCSWNAKANKDIFQICPNGSVTNYILSSQTNGMMRSAYGNFTTPVMTDEDLDGVYDHMYFVCNGAKIGFSNLEGICKYELGSNDLDTTVGNSGFLQPGYTSTDTRVTGIQAVRKNAQDCILHTVEEISITGRGNGLNDDVYVVGYYQDGSLCKGQEKICDDASASSFCLGKPLFQADVGGSIGPESCTWSRRVQSGDDTEYLYCINPSTGRDADLEFQSAMPSYTSDVQIPFNSVGAALDVDIAQDEIIGSNQVVLAIDYTTNIFTDDEMEIISNFSLGFVDEDRSVVFGDVDGDGSYDIVYSEDGETGVLYSGATNEPPTLFPSGDYGVIPKQPICLGTEFRIFGAECTEQTTRCNYQNDRVNDRERLVTSFNEEDITIDNVEQYAGNWSDTRPDIYHAFNEIGEFTISIILQDEANPTNLSQLDQAIITVFNGTPGLNCNLACTGDVCFPNPGTGLTIEEEGNTSDSTVDIQANVVAVSNQLAFGNQYVKNVASVILLTFLMIGLIAGARVTNPLILSIVLFLGMSFLALISFMSWIVAIGLGAFIIFISAMRFMFSGESSGGV